jgi:N-acetylglucosamine malate deacetylase 1
MSDPRRILVLAPHADDETLGMGGTIARFASAGATVTVAVLTGPGEDGAHPIYPQAEWDRVREEARSAFQVLGVNETIFENLPAVLVGDTPAWEVNRTVARVIADVRPHELYVPFPWDIHRDHRELFHAASVAWRPSSDTGRAIASVACYEVLSETHWNAPYVEPGFLPQRFVDVTATLQRKLDALRCYKSQMVPFPGARSIEAVEALARLRGAQIGCAAAEAFVVIREIS